MNAETSNARELVAKWRADSEIVAEYATTTFDLGRLAQGRVCADELEALLNAAPPASDAELREAMAREAGVVDDTRGRAK